jgi:hypothetical protein
MEEAFAKPVARDESNSDYIPTQILGEFFKSHGYDGVRYKSLLDPDGLNVALFDPCSAVFVKTSLFTVDGVVLKYSKCPPGNKLSL